MKENRRTVIQRIHRIGVLMQLPISAFRSLWAPGTQPRPQGGAYSLRVVCSVRALFTPRTAGQGVPDPGVIAICVAPLKLPVIVVIQVFVATSHTKALFDNVIYTRAPSLVRMMSNPRLFVRVNVVSTGLGPRSTT